MRRHFGALSHGEKAMRFAPVLCGVAITVACDVAGAQPNVIDLDRTPPAAALSEFWTEQQLRQTPPMPVPALDVNTEPLNPATPNSAAPPGQSKGSQPSAIARSSGNVNTMPLAWAGKLYFVLPDGRPANCSAQFVAPDTLVTAAHCVRDSQSGAWHQTCSTVISTTAADRRTSPPPARRLIAPGLLPTNLAIHGTMRWSCSAGALSKDTSASNGAGSANTA